MPVECSQIVIGCDALFRLTLVDDNGDPVSLTGNRILFAIRRAFRSCTPIVVEKDSNDGPSEIEILSTPDDNQALIKLLPADTDELEEGTYMYSVKVVLTLTSLTYVVAQGTVDIVASAFSSP